MTGNTAERSDIVGIILAGGQSRRMGGGDKGLRLLAGRPMLRHVVERLAPQVGQMVLNANGDPARFAAFGLEITNDPPEDYGGPLAGILAGLRWAATHAPDARFIATAATDTPFFPSDLVSRLRHEAEAAGAAIALARSGERVHPTFGVWPVALEPDLTSWLATAPSPKVLAWVDRHPNVQVQFGTESDFGLDPFFNANTPEDMERAEAALREAAP